MSKFDSGIRLPSKSARKPLKAEIMWGGENGGSPHFPRDMSAIHMRRNSLDPQPFTAFRHAVRNAVERVLVVDEFFLTPDGGQSPDDRILTILDWLHVGIEASDIRILTKKDDAVQEESLQLFQARAEEINTWQSRRLKQCDIFVNTNLKRKFDYIHDRFAIVDDELWHFGATVGGFHKSVNAASRGWSAEDSGAIKFFELAWSECKQ